MSWGVYLHCLAKKVTGTRQISVFTFRFKTLARRKRISHTHKKVFLSIYHILKRSWRIQMTTEKESQNDHNCPGIKANTNRKRLEKAQTLYLGAL